MRGPQLATRGFVGPVRNSLLPQASSDFVAYLSVKMIRIRAIYSRNLFASKLGSQFARVSNSASNSRKLRIRSRCGCKKQPNRHVRDYVRQIQENAYCLISATAGCTATTANVHGNHEISCCVTMSEVTFTFRPWVFEHFPALDSAHGSVPQLDIAEKNVSVASVCDNCPPVVGRPERAIVTAAGLPVAQSATVLVNGAGSKPRLVTVSGAPLTFSLVDTHELSPTFRNQFAMRIFTAPLK